MGDTTLSWTIGVQKRDLEVLRRRRHGDWKRSNCGLWTCSKAILGPALGHDCGDLKRPPLTADLANLCMPSLKRLVGVRSPNTHPSSESLNCKLLLAAPCILHLLFKYSFYNSFSTSYQLVARTYGLQIVYNPQFLVLTALFFHLIGCGWAVHMLITK